jgi:hypothetical protein
VFESFKAICYLPLIVFAIGWSFAQFSYFFLKKQVGSRDDYTNQLLESVRKNASNILVFGLGSVVMLLIGVYHGPYIRWFLFGVDILLIMFVVAKLGAAFEFSYKKLPPEMQEVNKLIVAPYVIQLTCHVITGVWMVYVFGISGL